MSTDSFLFQAFVYLAAAVVAVPIAGRLGLGSVLGYLIAGVVIGPFGLGLIGSEGEDVLHVAEFGVVMMLFLVGLELEPARLWRLRGPILGLGGLQVLLTALAIAALAMLIGLDWRAAVAVGLIVAMSSTAIALQSLTEKGLLRTAGGQSSFAVLLFQDIAVIPILAIFPLLAVADPAHGTDTHGAEAGHGAEAISLVAGLAPWLQTVVVLAAVIAVVLAGRYLVPPLFRAIAATRLRELFTAAALLLVIGIALLMQLVGLSPALGTFLAGVVLANSEYRHELESDIEPFKGLLLGLFFIAVGAAINLPLIVAEPLRIAALVLAIILVKLAVLFGLARAFRLGLDQSALFAFGLAQVGEFAFVLLSFAEQQSVLLPAVTSPLVAAVALSMALTPLLLLLNERLIEPRFGTRPINQREADQIDEENPVIIAGFGRFGSIVGRLLSANGVGATVLDNDSDRVDVLRRLGLKVYYGDASRLDLLHAAGAAHARILVLALDSPEKTLELVHTARSHFPNLTIFARAQDRFDASDLLNAGVQHVYRETLDTSLRLGIDTLHMLGRRAYSATRVAHTFFTHDEAALRDLARLRGDREGYLSAARQRIANLEQLLRAEIENRDLDRDAGWDIDSLRAEFAPLAQTKVGD